MTTNLTKPKSAKHPSRYTIFKPNILIKGDESSLRGNELRVYEEILNDNHQKNIDRLTYRIPYDLIFDDKTQESRNRSKLIGNIQSKRIVLDKEFMMEHFNHKGERGIVFFPSVTFDDENREFVVDINKDFKRILSLMDGQLSFSKGDIETLRSYKNDASHIWYWEARRMQTFKQVWEVDIADFKEVMGMEGQYKDYRNFKRRVLIPIYNDAKDTFMEFDENYEIKKGKGGKVVGLRFAFKFGPKDIADAPAGYDYSWERDLQTIGVGELAIKRIRHKVKANSEAETEEGKKFIWDSYYVVNSYSEARKEFQAKKADPKRKQIKNVAAWFIQGLEYGYWLDKIEQQAMTSQGQLFNDE